MVGQSGELDNEVRAILSSFSPFGVLMVMDESRTCARDSRVGSIGLVLGTC